MELQLWNNTKYIRYVNAHSEYFIVSLYTEISMLKDIWEDFSETKLEIKLAFWSGNNLEL